MDWETGFAVFVAQPNYMLFLLTAREQGARHKVHSVLVSSTFMPKKKKTRGENTPEHICTHNNTYARSCTRTHAHT